MAGVDEMEIRAGGLGVRLRRQGRALRAKARVDERGGSGVLVEGLEG